MATSKAPKYTKQGLADKQAYDKAMLALDQRMKALDPVYAKQATEAKKMTDAARLNADLAATARGMGRSSYNQATMANIDLEGAKTQAEIQAGLAAAKTNILGQKSLAAQQLAEKLAQYGYQKSGGGTSQKAKTSPPGTVPSQTADEAYMAKLLGVSVPAMRVLRNPNYKPATQSAPGRRGYQD